MYAYITLSLLTGIRTEEARALRWAHVDLDGDPAASPPVPPHVAVWRSVRATATPGLNAPGAPSPSPPPPSRRCAAGKVPSGGSGRGSVLGYGSAPWNWPHSW
jgi:hypothetical protein